LLIARQIPHTGWGQAGIALFDTNQVLHLLLGLFDLFFDRFDFIAVGTETVGFQESDISLVKRWRGFFFVFLSYSQLTQNDERARPFQTICRSHTSNKT
jgi:hypothetical protein